VKNLGCFEIVRSTFTTTRVLLIDVDVNKDVVLLPTMALTELVEGSIRDIRSDTI
jgi:hypothetical protein